MFILSFLCVVCVCVCVCQLNRDEVRNPCMCSEDDEKAVYAKVELDKNLQQAILDLAEGDSDGEDEKGEDPYSGEDGADSFTSDEEEQSVAEARVKTRSRP